MNTGMSARNTKQSLTAGPSPQALHRRAEEKALLDETTALKTLTLEDAQQLFHELRVYQIELEIQNDELRRAQHELEVSRARYFDLYDLAPVGYLTLNAKGRVQEVNIAAAAMLGVERNKMIGKPISKFIFHEDQDIYYLHRRKVFEVHDVQVWEMRLNRANGSPFWAYLRALPADNGTYWITLIDITERKRADQELQQAKEAAEDANRAKSDFLATMSHEIRTPLGAMLGNVELLENSPLTPQQQEYLKDCKSASQILLQVINDVLDLSKIEAGKVELVNEIFSVSSMGRQLMRIFSASAQQKGLDLSVSCADDLPEYIFADKQRLRQILSNLLGNAVKFSRHGAISLEIAREQAPSAANQDKTVLHIVVRDTGIGIPPDKLDHIFDSFTQVESFITRSASGTGLGLTISQRLLALMGGTITVSSVPGEGSVFTVLLPVTEAHPQPQPLPEPDSEPQPPSRKVLLADDDERGRTVAQKLLQRRGYKVTAVENGAGLLEALREEEFDIVLTDISMPDMEGTHVARIIRSGNRVGIDPRIPIIAMTAHAFSDDRERFLAAGINGYVAKPVNLEELFRQIEELCNREGAE